MKFKAAVNATLSREKVVVHRTYDHGFDCQSGHDCVATLDSLFTPLCPWHQAVWISTSESFGLCRHTWCTSPIVVLQLKLASGWELQNGYQHHLVGLCCSERTFLFSEFQVTVNVICCMLFSGLSLPLGHLLDLVAHQSESLDKFIYLIPSVLLPLVLWRHWLGGRKGIRPVKNWVVGTGCWYGYLSRARCRLAYGPADATATHCLLLQ